MQGETTDSLVQVDSLQAGLISLYQQDFLLQGQLGTHVYHPQLSCGIKNFTKQGKLSLFGRLSSLGQFFETLSKAHYQILTLMAFD